MLREMERAARGIVAFEAEPLDVRDRARGFLAGLAGRRALDTSSFSWSASARALVRASHFNEGVTFAEAWRPLVSGRSR